MGPRALGLNEALLLSIFSNPPRSVNCLPTFSPSDRICTGLGAALSPSSTPATPQVFVNPICPYTALGKRHVAKFVLRHAEQAAVAAVVVWQMGDCPVPG